MRKSRLYAFALIVLALSALGLIVLCSASQANAMRLYHDSYFFLKRQSLYLAAGIVIAIIVAATDYRIWARHRAFTWSVLVVVLLLLCAVFPPLGRMVNGSYRWIKVGPVNIQPSEFAKLATVIVMAMWLDGVGWRVELFSKGALCPALICGVLAAPVLLEPDFGSVMVIGLLGCLLMIVGGTRLRHLSPVGLVGAAVLVAKVATNKNRMSRIAAWMGVDGASSVASLLGLDSASAVVDKAAERAAYQANMALVAIKNGGLWGVGLGQSVQKQAYLPEAHTDFIFAIGAEELGLIFSLGTVLLFFAIFILSIYIARNAADRFGRMLVIGMATLIVFQAIFNIGVVCEALPTKGMALPFFSYGGTNMLSAFFAVGTILSVGIHSYRDQKRIVKRNVFG